MVFIHVLQAITTSSTRGLPLWGYIKNDPRTSCRGRRRACTVAATAATSRKNPYSVRGLVLFQLRNEEGTPQQNGRLVEALVLVALRGKVSHTRASWGSSGQKISHLRVPIPPASIRNAGPSCKVFPTQRIAKARRIWPWATISTSPWFPSDVGFPITGACHFSRISLISRSTRSVTSAGLLQRGRRNLARGPLE